MLFIDKYEALPFKLLTYYCLIVKISNVMDAARRIKRGSKFRHNVKIK